MNFSGLFHNLGPLTITGLAQGAIIALFALGYTLVYGVLRLINFAHSEVFMVGTFAAANGAIGSLVFQSVSPSDVTVGSVDGSGGFPDTNGVATTGGDVTIRSNAACPKPAGP